MNVIFILLLLLFCDAGDQTQGLMRVMQVLYH
jgi:hypothetical protein